MIDYAKLYSWSDEDEIEYRQWKSREKPVSEIERNSSIFANIFGKRDR